MPKQTAYRPANRIIAQGLIAAESIAKQLRDQLTRLLVGSTRLNDFTLFGRAEELIDGFQPLFWQVISDADMAAWVHGSVTAANNLPAAAIRALSTPLIPPGLLTGIFEPPKLEIETGILKWPKLEHAANDLLSRNVVTPDEFQAMTAVGKRNAFTVSNTVADDTVGKVRDILAENIREGMSPRKFRETVKEKLGTGAVGGNLDTIFRSTVQSSLSRGQEIVASNPIVRNVLPYAKYRAIRDGRVRDDHWELENGGLDGTGIYRSDDTNFWRYRTPPWDFNCRCFKGMMTVRQAANAGVREARKWLRTGIPPEEPEWVDGDFPPPESGFVGPGAGLQQVALSLQRISMGISMGISMSSGSWVPYEGPRGGKGWRSSETGEVVYQDEKPGEGESGDNPPQRKSSPQVQAWAAKRFKDPAHAKAFTEWFGDSKVVDENGEPLTVYHGTRSENDIVEFKTFGHGASDAAFFAPTPDEAKHSRGVQEKVLPVHLSLQNPMLLDTQESAFIVGEVGPENEIINKAAAEGFDSVIFNHDDPAMVTYAVFEPNQIKSATGNRGTFNPNSNDIRMARQFVP